MSFGDFRPNPPDRVTLETASGYGYYGNQYEAKLVERTGFRGLFMEKFVDTEFTRVSGSHRDFPFDSAQIDYGIDWRPRLPIKGLMIRNYNSSFYLPCDSISLKSSEGKVRVLFELKRHSLVQLAAVVLLGAAFVFAIAIALFVKSDSLPTAIASYFFSLWSIRSILNSEIKTFPTILDLTVLSLCVLVVSIVALRLGWTARPRTTLHAHEPK